MTSGLFVRMGTKTKQLLLELTEELEDDNVAVWRAKLDDEERYVETPLDAELWDVVDRVVHCYEESES